MPRTARRGRAVAGAGLALGAVLAGAAVMRPPPPAPVDPSVAAEPPADAPVVVPAGVVVPEGMAYVPGGPVDVGSTDGPAEEQPVFRAEVRPFLMDVHPVTVAQFRRFVEATGHVTEAERLGDAGVFDTSTRQWTMVRGATWRRPLGPEHPAAPDDHPVTQVSWNDAVAYARWAGKRLPTEVEWEHAARGGRNRRTRYSWGDHLQDEQGRHHANTWNGTFPGRDSGEDGYRATTSPVGAFGRTALGISDLGGNVWEWTADWYRSYAERDLPFTPTAQSERAQRGGSYLCSPDFCHGFRVSGRSHSTPETSLAHLGFRLVRDLE